MKKLFPLVASICFTVLMFAMLIFWFVMQYQGFITAWLLILYTYGVLHLWIYLTLVFLYQWWDANRFGKRLEKWLYRNFRI